MNSIDNIVSSNISVIILVLSIISIILLITTIILLTMIVKLKARYQRFMQGKDAKSLEKDIIALYEDNKIVKEGIIKNQKEINEIFEKQKVTFQKMGLAKYDAFKEMGGKLSYALALLDENNDGFIINSVHSSEGCYSYTKRIKNADSDISLSNEEKVAIDRALKGTASNPTAE